VVNAGCDAATATTQLRRLEQAPEPQTPESIPRIVEESVSKPPFNYPTLFFDVIVES